MNTRRTHKDKPPAIIHGARALAVLSLIWSGYAITDLMHSGPFGVSVALAGDIGWLTVLWAEWRGITIGGRSWAAPVAGWLIALGVAVLLVIHGAEAGGRAQAIAGPFVVLVGKVVWAFALAALKDPAALTAEQEAEIHGVMRDSEYQARLHHAALDGIERAADAEIARIQAEARTVLARDEADFQITLERGRKRGEIERRTPLAIAPSPRPAEQPNVFAEPAREQSNTATNTIASDPSAVREQIANSATSSTNPPNAGPSIADLVREQVARTTNNAEAVRNVMAARPSANKESVAAAVRRERRRNEPKDGYA